MRCKEQRGFTLIEILISMIILAVGFLGLAALQSSSVQGTQGTYFFTQADLLANDLAERMRGNALEARTGGYALAMGDTSSAGVAQCGAGVECTAVEMADAEKNEWLGWVENALPNGQAEVAQNATPFWVITLLWDERRNGATGTGCDSDDEDDLTCFRLNVEI